MSESPLMKRLKELQIDFDELCKAIAERQTRRNTNGGVV